MKKIILLLLAITMAAGHAMAQLCLPAGTQTDKQVVPSFLLCRNMTVHLVSPEPIKYVDISSKKIASDVSVKNILRVGYLRDSLGSEAPPDAVITIVGESFIAQYRVIYSPDCGAPGSATEIMIGPQDTRPLEFPGISLSQAELKSYAMRLTGQRCRDGLSHASAFGIKAKVNQIFTLGDYIFLDIGCLNTKKIKYDIDQVRFAIQDRKRAAAENMQSLEITPEFTLFGTGSFKRHYRNVFVFRKFTFPGNRVFHVEISEKPVSGRTISLDIPYKELLSADIMPPF